MRWLRSTTNKSYIISGKIVPRVSERKYLSLPENDFIVLEKMPVVKSLLTSGAIYVTDRQPKEITDTIAVNNEVVELRQKLAEAEAKANSVDVEKIKEEAVAELRKEALDALTEKDAEIARLRALLGEEVE